MEVFYIVLCHLFWGPGRSSIADGASVVSLNNLQAQCNEVIKDGVVALSSNGLGAKTDNMKENGIFVQLF